MYWIDEVTHLLDSEYLSLEYKHFLSKVLNKEFIMTFWRPCIAYIHTEHLNNGEIRFYDSISEP